jgi:hypothetical protein
MRHIYEDRNGEQHDYSQPPCESLVARNGLIKVGVILNGKFMTNGEFEAMGVRVRQKQSEAFDKMLNQKIWAVDERVQLNLWGIQ